MVTKITQPVAAFECEGPAGVNEAPPVLSKNATVFVVDDDEAVRDSLCALLESFRFSVQDFETTDQFLEAVGNGASFQRRCCLILDLHLPRSGGLALLHALSGQGIDIPVIVVTGSLDAQTRSQVMEAGAVAALEKPFEDLTLLDMICAALDRTT